MASSRFAFSALLKKVNPPSDRAAVAQRLPGEVREWLKEHEFPTVAPHTRLIGSHGRKTAITNIKDVDTLLFLSEEALDRTPESVLRELKALLDDYPDAFAETAPQRRSIRLDFPLHDLSLDIVGAVADGGLEKPLWVPDRSKQQWLQSDPLGYGRTLSSANADADAKLVPLVKLAKAWRDEQMVSRRPKSYLLEVIVFSAVDSGAVDLKGRSTGQNVCDLFEHLASKWEKLMDGGDGVPRVLDPQLNTVLSASWERSHFETFMRRLRESAKDARAALDADTDEDAAPNWKKVFEGLWPTEAEVKAEALEAAHSAQPGTARISNAGAVSSAAVAGSFVSRPTTFHGRG